MSVSGKLQNLSLKENSQAESRLDQKQISLGYIKAVLMQIYIPINPGSHSPITPMQATKRVTLGQICNPQCDTWSYCPTCSVQIPMHNKNKKVCFTLKTSLKKNPLLRRGEIYPLILIYHMLQWVEAQSEKKQCMCSKHEDILRKATRRWRGLRYI